jgi:hypothetical protein
MTEYKQTGSSSSSKKKLTRKNTAGHQSQYFELNKNKKN